MLTPIRNGVVPIDVERLGDGVDDPRRHGFGLVDVQRGQQDHELVAADPEDQVDVADRIAQPMRHGHQDGVAGRVAVAIIGGLEAVEVEAERRQLPAAAVGRCRSRTASSSSKHRRFMIRLGRPVSGS